MNRIKTEFLIRPIEPVYFGKPNSFQAGENHHGISEFPLTPYAFQGILRSHLLRSVVSPILDLNDWSAGAVQERIDLVGTSDRLPEGWQIKGPLPVTFKEKTIQSGAGLLKASPWVPTPRFMVGKPPLIHARIVQSQHTGKNDLASKIPLIGRPREDALSCPGGWIGPDNLAYALCGEYEREWNVSEYALDYPPFVKNEFAPGVAIDPATRTSRESMLYFLQTLRFDNQSGFIGWFSGNTSQRINSDVFSGGVVGAGRKGRVTVIEKISSYHESWQFVSSGRHLPQKVPEGQRFWLLLVTPCRLDNVLHPRLNIQMEGLNINFEGALTGPLITLGGYAMATGTSRSNKQYVPAGSAWLFHISGGNEFSRASWLRQINNTNSLGDPEESRFGFGHALVGIGPLKGEY